jgi:hypothetical protein
MLTQGEKQADTVTEVLKHHMLWMEEEKKISLWCPGTLHPTQHSCQRVMAALLEGLQEAANNQVGQRSKQFH